MCSIPSVPDTLRPFGKSLCSPQSDVQVTGALFLYECYRLLPQLDVEHLLGLRKRNPNMCVRVKPRPHTHTHTYVT